MNGSADGLAELSHDQRLDRLVELQRIKACADTEQQRLLALIAADPCPHPHVDRFQAKEWVREEVACALSLAPRTAAAWLHQASELVDRLPATLAAMDRGDIGLTHARALVDAVGMLDDQVTARIEARVLARAEGKTVGEFRQHVKRAVLSLDPRSGDTKHRDAMSERRVRSYPDEDGMSILWAYLPADGATRLMCSLDTRAGLVAEGDERSADQRRAACSPTPPGGCSTMPASPTARRQPWPTTSEPEIEPADSPAAPDHSTAATSIMSWPGTTAAPPTKPTCTASANDTII